MEKILLAIDAQQVNMNAVDFASYLARLTHSKVTGVFLENLLSEDKPVVKSLQDLPYLESILTTNLPGNEALRTLTEENIHRFKDACENRCVQPLIHRDRGVPAAEIVAESRFADIIIVDAETSFSKNREGSPARFVKDILLEAECPVIIAPYSFDAIDHIIFTYNATRSSVFAIKQFTYLFPELRQKKAIVVHITDKDEKTIEEKYKMNEWLKNHYSDVEFVVLKGKSDAELFGWLLEKKNAMVVMGAYGRNLLSRFFRPSHAGLIIKAVNLPVFITHY